MNLGIYPNITPRLQVKYNKQDNELKKEKISFGMKAWEVPGWEPFMPKITFADLNPKTKQLYEKANEMCQTFYTNLIHKFANNSKKNGIVINTQNFLTINKEYSSVEKNMGIIYKDKDGIKRVFYPKTLVEMRTADYPSSICRIAPLDENSKEATYEIASYLDYKKPIKTIDRIESDEAGVDLNKNVQEQLIAVIAKLEKELAPNVMRKVLKILGF